MSLKEDYCKINYKRAFLYYICVYMYYICLKTIYDKSYFDLFIIALR